jgi:hypothetical protein
LRLDKIEKAIDLELRRKLPSVKLPNCASRSAGCRIPPSLSRRRPLHWPGSKRKTSGLPLITSAWSSCAAEIKPLFRTVSEADFKAMRFEKDVLELSLALLGKEKIKFDTLREGIVEQIGRAAPVGEYCGPASRAD